MRFSALFLLLCFSLTVTASQKGRDIYLRGVDESGEVIEAYMNGVKSFDALACVKCHRESGLGSSESGKTIPPVSWLFLSKKQPNVESSLYYNIQNKRAAYDSKKLHRMLTTGVNSNGLHADRLMPIYNISEQQTEQLVTYLKELYRENDPGVDEDTIKIATIIDQRLPLKEKEQHLQFMQGLFKMKNALTRGELKRKKYAPIQKVPQYESYRKWDLVVWDLPEDIRQWESKLDQYYSEQPVFVVLTPQVMDNYSTIQDFCGEQKLPCLFGRGTIDTKGDYYNFVFKDIEKQQRDYIASQLRTYKDKVYFLDTQGDITKVAHSRVDIPFIKKTSPGSFANNFSDICAKDYVLLVKPDIRVAEELYNAQCASEQKIKIKLLGNPLLDYEAIAGLLKQKNNPQICWASDYDKVLKRNMRRIRVDAMVRRFGIENPEREILARSLFAYSLLTDTMHQLTTYFSRQYLLENIEHMLNSFPNFTYFSTVSGAPYQRAIVGPFKDFCPPHGKVS